jgi:hypothetical protein
VSHYYWFGFVAAPFTVALRLDNGVTLRFELSRNVTRVRSFFRSGVNRRLRMATLYILLFYRISVWTDQGGQWHRFICIFKAPM